MKRIKQSIYCFILIFLFSSIGIAADKRIQYNERMVGANHPLLTDTLNRLMLVEHNNDGTHAAIISTALTALTTLAESWIGPTSTTGVYFKGGNVGIGTTSPGTKLEIGGIPDSDFLTFSQGTSYKHTLSSYMGSVGTSYLSFNINNGSNAITNNVLVLKGSGNVGIGTSNPGSQLEVYAGADTSQVLWGQNIKNNGNGNTSGYGVGLKLKISSDTGLNEPYKWGGIAAIAGSNYANSTDLALYTNAGVSVDPTEKVRILGSGNVGIGTTSPSAKLAINGGLHVGGDSDPGDNNAIIDGTLSTGPLTVNGGTNVVYYCNGGVSAGNMCRGNGCSCVGGAWVAISLTIN